MWNKRKLEAAVIACAIMLGTVGLGAKDRPRSMGWTHYVNARWKFCADYPARWKATTLADGSGATFYPDDGADPSGDPHISISAVPDQPDVDNANIVLDDSPPLNLEGNFDRALDALRQYEHASDIRVLEKRAREFQGFDALRTSIRYRTTPNGAEVADETLWINEEYVIFTASLLGRPRQVRELEPVYREIVKHRFKLECGVTK